MAGGVSCYDYRRGSCYVRMLWKLMVKWKVVVHHNSIDGGTAHLVIQSIVSS